MKNIILEELANAWDLEVEADATRDGAIEAEMQNARKDGYNDGIKEAAKRLRVIIGIFK